MDTSLFFTILNARKLAMQERIERYTEHVEADKKLIAETAHPEKYSKRLRNHEAKLARAKAILATTENELHQMFAEEHEQTEQLTVSLEESQRGQITVAVTTPAGTEKCSATKLSDLFHLRLDALSMQAEAWLRCANVLHLHLHVVAKLRKGKAHTVRFSPLHYQTILQQVHTDRNGMYTRPDTPKLALV